jgi:hypothetical protein
MWTGRIKTVPELMSPDSPGAAPFGGAQILTPLAVGNTPVAGPLAGVTSAELGAFSALLVNQTTAGMLALTLPSPAPATAVYVETIGNVGTTAFSMYGVPLQPGQATQIVWNGSAFTGLTPANGVGTALLQVQQLAAQSIPSGAFTVHTASWFVDLDPFNGFDATTGVYTAPLTGLYQAQMQNQFVATATAVNTKFQAALFLNGFAGTAGQTVSQNAAAIVEQTVICPPNAFRVAQGDQIDFRLFQDSGGPINTVGDPTRNTALLILLA